MVSPDRYGIARRRKQRHDRTAAFRHSRRTAILILAMLTGDTSIQKRPMKRVMTPLSYDGRLVLHSVSMEMAVHRFQIKEQHACTASITSHRLPPPRSNRVFFSPDCMQMAPTSVTEPAVSRNHSELMLRYFGADIQCEGTNLHGSSGSSG